MKREKTFTKGGVFAVLLLIFAVAIFAGVNSRALAAVESGEDYTFETVPVEKIEISVDGNLSKVQPRQQFTVSYEVSPWYTTTKEVYFNISPATSATVGRVSTVELKNGKAVGNAVITVSPDAEVGSTFSVNAGVDGIESNSVEMTVEKIPVNRIKLSLQGNDDKLHIGKTRSVACEFTPSYASDLSLRYELSGDGMKYIEYFDEENGVIKAKQDVSVIDVNSTVTLTAYSIDNPNAYDSVTMTLYMPTTVVEIFADTPLGRYNSQGQAMAIANSGSGDTVFLRATVNGVDSAGLNYVIVKGQEYVEDGYVHSDGSFTLRPTSDWSESMKKPHPEVKIRAAYSDGFDEITVAVYIPVESLTFINAVDSKVENFRSYNLKAQALPEYATLLADSELPIIYSLGDTDSSVAFVDSEGLLTLPKSLTSKGSVIGFSANLVNAWEGVDVMPLRRNLTVMPVYAKWFESVKIVKDEIALDNEKVKALPSDLLRVAVVYDVDNVTDIDITLSQNSDIIATSGDSITVSSLSAMKEDNPFIEIDVIYDHGGNVFSKKCYLSIYIPALSGEIADANFQRDDSLDLNSLITINGHGHASNKTVEWGEPIVTADKNGIGAKCEDGFLYISTFANAGTKVRVPYRTFDSNAWQYKDFTVSDLNERFSLEYMQTSGKDNKKYDVNPVAPQLEEGQSVSLHLKYKGLGGKVNFGLTYSVEVSSNATFAYSSGIKDYDAFTLSVKSGQSGRDNYVTYKITVHDGTATYYIYTDGVSAPNGSQSKAENLEKISVFKRVSGTLSVSHAWVEVGDIMDLTGWDSSFTYNREDLVWSISGGKMEGNKIAEAPRSGFTLTITANQKYNGTDINFYSEVFFSSIIYYYENDSNEIKHKKSVYKREGCSITIEGELCTRDGYLQIGWSTANKGQKDYEFGEIYSGAQDKDLYAYWVRTSFLVHIGQDGDVDGNSGGEEIQLDENQNKDFYTRNYLVDLNIDLLKELGYTKIDVNISALLERILHDGKFAKMWLDINGSTVRVWDKFEPTKSKSWNNNFSVTVDISKFTQNTQIRLGFYTYDDGIWDKFTWKFYEAKIRFTATK